VLQTSLGVAWMTIKGYATPEVAAAYGRALALCRQLEDTAQLFPVLFGLLLFYLMCGQPKTAQEIETQLQHLTQRHQDPSLLVGVHFVSGVVSFLQGKFASAHTAWERCLAMYEPQQASVYVSLYGLDPGVVAGVLSAFVCWVRGYAEQALHQAQVALTQAQTLSHAHTQGFTLFWTAHLYQARREIQAVQVHAKALRSLTQEYGHENGLAHGMIMQGWALAEQKEVEKGVAWICDGLAMLRAAGAESGQSCFLLCWLRRIAREDKSERD
jgi:predicted ATPase